MPGASRRFTPRRHNGRNLKSRRCRHIRSAASQIDPHRLPDAGIRGGRRRCGPGGVPSLVRCRSRRSAGAGSVLAPRRNTPLPGSIEIRPAAARNICRAVAARTGCRRSRQRDRRCHAASDDGARAPFAAGTRCLSSPRRVWRQLRGDRRNSRPRTGGMPPAGRALMCAPNGRAFIYPKNEVWRSQPHFSRRHAAAICRDCSCCWLPT